MRNVSRLFLFALILCGVMACQPKAVKYTLVQYNVGAFKKYDGSSIDAIARVVKELKADAVTFNEVDSCSRRTGSVDQLKVFAESMGDWSQFYAAAMPFRGGAYGVGVAASAALKVLRTDKIALPKLNGYEPRAVALAEYEDFVLCSTHLDLTLESQIGQIEAINHYVDSVYAGCNKPIFIGGDFNALPESESIKLMQQTWQLLTPLTFSFPAPAPSRCIDYVFVRPNGREVSVEAASIPVTLQNVDLSTASDHLPVVLTVTIK